MWSAVGAARRSVEVRRSAWVVLVGLWFLIAVACSGRDGSVTGIQPVALRGAVTSVPSSVIVTPGSAAGTLGQSAQFSATVRDAGGALVSGPLVAWSSTDSTIVSINSSGFARAIGVGAVSLRATVGAVVGEAQVSVSGVPIASIAVSPGQLSGSVGQSAQLSASVLDATGAVLQGRRVLWVSSAPSIVRVDSVGVATAVSAGSATISATSGGKTGTATATVTGGIAGPPTGVSGLAVTTTTDSAITISFAQVADGTGMPANYEVRAATPTLSWGTASAVTKGTCAGPIRGTAVGAMLTCTIGGLAPTTSYQAQVVSFRGVQNVSAVFGPLSNVASGATLATGSVVATVTVTPGSASGTVGQTGQFSAVAKDASGNVLTGKTITWSSTNAAIATVDQSGLATAIGPGSAAIVATVQGKTGQAAITVTGGAAGGTASQSKVSPSSASVATGATLQLTASVTDVLGNLLGGLVTTWASSNTAVATVSSSGVVTGISAGSVTITASTLGIVATSSVTVMSVSPPPSGSEPVYAAGLGTLIWKDSFDGLLSDVAMLANYSVLNGQFIHVDAGAGIGGSTAARVDWFASTGCQDQSRVLEKGIAPTREIYAQYSVRYSPNFVFDWTHSGYNACTGNAKKLFFLYAGSGSSRFDFISENHVLGMGGDYDHPLFSQTAGPAVTDEQFGDGNWHRVTIHVIQSSTPSSADGLIEGWIDGVKRWYVPNWVSNSGGGWTYFRLPATFNQGSPVNQSEWFDNLTVWRP